MNEQTNPEGGVSQELTPQQRMENLLMQPEGQAEEGEPEAQDNPETEQEQPEGQAESDEVTPDDIPDETQEEAQPAVDEFEIVHEGQQVKLSREKTIELAQQGFDYTRKTQALAEKNRVVDAYIEQLAQIDQVRPHLQQHEGQVRALEMQLSQYQNVDWVKEATEDPIGYTQKRAQYDILRDSHARAFHQFQQAEQHVKSELAKVDQQRRYAEAQRLPEFIPEWKDAAKRQAGEAEIVKHYATQYGVSQQELSQHMKGALSLAVVYKAMKYDQLTKAKSEKVKQLRTAPPVTKPGAKLGSAKADKDIALRQSLRKTGSAQDAMAVLLNRMK